MPVHSHAEGLEELVERAEKLPPIRMAVIAADQALVLQSVVQARKAGLIVPLLIGAPDEIIACAGEIDADITGVEIITAIEAEEAARVGVDLVRGGRAEALMKGRFSILIAGSGCPTSVSVTYLWSISRPIRNCWRLQMRR